LKTPIAIIQGYAEGLKDNINEDQESREYYIDVIIDEAQKMNNMVKKLLDLNHIEFGDSPLNIERFDIMEIIRATLSATEILAKQKNVKIILRCPEKLFVWADEYMLEEVLNNYLSNAYNHVDTNGVIDISISCFESVARIYVYNSGSSIPKDELEKVWLKFYKVDKARTREYGGSGVGLSIVKAIMDSHNKKYGVENYKSGVRFWFEVDVKSIE
jgi:signal transduction histidine kinase